MSEAAADLTELRDKLALNAPNMDALDIRDLMGWESEIPLGDPFDLEEESTEAHGGWKDTVWNRWAQMPLATRLAAYARYSYAWADAMLKERGRAA